MEQSSENENTHDVIMNEVRIKDVSCPYAWPHTCQPVTGVPIMLLGLMYVLKVNVHF